MRPTAFTLLASFLVGSSFAHGQTIQVGNLRCEYLNDPMGVDTAQPRLSWTIQSQQRGQRQTAYELAFCDTPHDSAGELESDPFGVRICDKVFSDETAHVVYAGSPLASRQVCYWKVRAWDRDGKPSDWSKAARWEMGLLKPGDWSAQWIEADLKKNEGGSTAGPVPILRKSFALPDKPIVKARVYATALGLYEMRINGRRVGDHVLAPDWTDYRKRVRYQVYDVASLLKQGDNAVAALLGNGWYCGHIGNGGFQFFGKRTGLAGATRGDLRRRQRRADRERCKLEGPCQPHPRLRLHARRIVRRDEGSARLGFAGAGRRFLARGNRPRPANGCPACPIAGRPGHATGASDGRTEAQVGQGAEAGPVGLRHGAEHGRRGAAEGLGPRRHEADPAARGDAQPGRHTCIPRTSAARCRSTPTSARAAARRSGSRRSRSTASATSN